MNQGRIQHEDLDLFPAPQAGENFRKIKQKLYEKAQSIRMMK